MIGRRRIAFLGFNTKSSSLIRQVCQNRSGPISRSSELERKIPPSTRCATAGELGFAQAQRLLPQALAIGNQHVDGVDCTVFVLSGIKLVEIGKCRRHRQALPSINEAGLRDWRIVSLQSSSLRLKNGTRSRSCLIS